MGRNIIHKVQSEIFAAAGRPFTFLSYREVLLLCAALRDRVSLSGYRPDVIVQVANGGAVPAEMMGTYFGVDVTDMKVSHYSMTIGGIELDEIVGVYRLSKMLGHRPKTRIERDVDKEKVSGKRVLVVDDDSYSGKTLEIARKSVEEKSPLEVMTAVLHTYVGNPAADFAGKWVPREEYYAKRLRFPWSKISPFYVDTNVQGPCPIHKESRLLE